MGAINPLRSLVLLASCTLLPACVQPQVQQRATPDSAVRDVAPEAVTPERVAELAQQLESVSRYAARMEELYAAQETEILALRQKVASLASERRASD